MPIQSPFHPRTSVLCESLRWKNWAGYFTVCSYDTSHDREYYAIRHAAALIDVTPLFKYDVRGKDAARFLSRVMAKDITRLKQNQVTYCCWCDEDGKVLDDGTVTRFEEDFFRVTAAEPTYAWLVRLSRGYQVQIEDVSDAWATLSVQGPLSRELLKQVVSIDMDALGYFKAARTQLGKHPLIVSRTGYTGDLGFELWIPNEGALNLWDTVANEGRAFGAEAVGLDAMDVSRIEAGYIMNGVDYYSANRVMIESRKSSPFEIGLGWTVQLERDPFIGQKALIEEKARGSKKSLVCLDIDWPETEKLFSKMGLPPEIPSAPWRTHVPVYSQNGEHIGKATSGVFSPILKKNIALAQIQTDHAEIGSQVRFEMTVDTQRLTVPATIRENPLFNPERKRSTPMVAAKSQAGLTAQPPTRAESTEVLHA